MNTAIERRLEALERRKDNVARTVHFIKAIDGADSNRQIAELEAAGKPIGGNDLLIAAHACATGATVVTANVDEFKRIRGLKVENWLA